jgi:hypothetical protein
MLMDILENMEEQFDLLVEEIKKAGSPFYASY